MTPWHYVDDTLALIKESDIGNVLNKLNGFHPSLNFKVNTFDDGVVYYLDLKLLIMKLIFIIKTDILVNTRTFPVTHPGILKQLGLEPCITELQKYVVIRNYWMIK